VDFVAGVQGVKVFGFVEVPEHGCAVFAAGGAEGAVWGDGDGVDVAGVPDVVSLDAASSQIPDLHELIPASTDNNRVLGIRRESYARDPISVSLFRDCVLAITESVPQLYGSIARAGDDLAIIRRETNREDVVFVTDKSAGGLTG